ncbi:1 TM domain-containing transmembrane protein [Acrasis kona]|uniref:1 TM domain-containing transmembrane protein n=1 Tax=Acrasis kona TaxID=1008807 RepID=A0AAW2YRS1_9EUKA
MITKSIVPDGDHPAYLNDIIIAECILSRPDIKFPVESLQTLINQAEQLHQEENSYYMALILLICEFTFCNVLLIITATLKCKCKITELESIIPSDSNIDYNNIFSFYDDCIEECANIRLQHYDAKSVSSSLLKLSKGLKTSEESRFIFLNNPEAFESLLISLRNVDESILQASCNLTYNLVNNDKYAQFVFMNRGGLPILCNSIRDENQYIQMASLKILALFVSEFPDLTLSDENISVVRNVVELLSGLYSDGKVKEINIALKFLAQIAKSENVQNYFRESTNIFERLDELFENCVSKYLDSNMDHNITLLIDSVCLCLNNLLFCNKNNQDKFRSHRYVGNCLSLICSRDLLPVQTNIYVLDVLSNFVNTNANNQNVLGSSTVLSEMQEHLLTNKNADICNMSCVLLSHLTWNNIDNQKLFGTTEIIKILLDMIQNHSYNALLCLTNMVYQNEGNQNLVSLVGGIQVLYNSLHHLEDYAFEKMLVLCIDNAVTNNIKNCKDFIDCGGVEKLINYMTEDKDEEDEEEDELSNKAFSTLTHLKSQGLSKLLQIVEQLINETTNDPSQVSLLNKHLPVVNGMVYMDGSDDFDLKCDVFQMVLKLFNLNNELNFCDDESNISEYAAFILCNLTTSYGSGAKRLQEWARNNDVCFEVLTNLLVQHDEDPGDLETMICNILYNLCFGNEASMKMLTDRKNVLESISHYCTFQDEEFDRIESVKLFLLLYEENKTACERMIGSEKCISVLETILRANLSKLSTSKSEMLLRGGLLHQEMK